MRNLIAVAVYAAVIGCAHTWAKPDATPDQVLRDTAECKRDAAPARAAAVFNDVFAACMRARGYKQ
jgi:hypothetical protein